jgi:hypothetical protein
MRKTMKPRKTALIMLGKVVKMKMMTKAIMRKRGTTTAPKRIMMGTTTKVMEAAMIQTATAFLAGILFLTRIS